MALVPPVLPRRVGARHLSRVQEGVEDHEGRCRRGGRGIDREGLDELVIAAQSRQDTGGGVTDSGGSRRAVFLCLEIKEVKG